MKAVRWAGGLVLAVLVSACAAPHPASAQDHPHYLHALTDLRMARALLDNPQDRNAAQDQQIGIAEITQAINELKRASIDDHKDLNEHPPIDSHLDRGGRLHHVMELLDSVNRDLHAEEDNKAALGWRDAALHHVDEARNATYRVMQDGK